MKNEEMKEKWRCREVFELISHEGSSIAKYLFSSYMSEGYIVVAMLHTTPETGLCFIVGV